MPGSHHERRREMAPPQAIPSTLARAMTPVVSRMRVSTHPQLPANTMTMASTVPTPIEPMSRYRNQRVTILN